MKLEEYDKARRLMLRIEEFEKMGATLRSAAMDVKKQHKQSDAEDIASLILKLSETKEGEQVIDYIVGSLTWKFEEAKRQLENQFDEL